MIARSNARGIVEEVEVTFYSEGSRLAGTLFSLAHDDGSRRPGVVLCHGYNGVRKLYLPDAARVLAGAGYVALTFDYKGWGDSEGPPLRLDAYGRVADAAAAITHLSALPGVDPDRIGLFGWSFGGSTAIWCAAFDRRATAVVSVVGVGDGARWMRSVRTDEEWRNLMNFGAEDRLNRARTGQSAMCDRPFILRLDSDSLQRSAASRSTTPGAADRIPAEFIDETLAFRPELVVRELSPTPLLLIACERDEVVPAAESESLFAAAQDPKKLVVLRGRGHYDVYAGEAFDQVMIETLEWFGRSFNKA